MENNTTIFLPVCDKGVTAEVGCDYSMPDYQPEVRRLLRVRATVLPPSSYVGAGKAEFAGAVRYDILYSGNDGKLYSATTSENYELSAPFEKDADVDYSDDLPAFCEILPEVVTGRVTAPRKLSIRCRLRGKIRVFGRHRLCERMMGDVPGTGVERLAGESVCAVLTGRTSESFTLSDELTADTSAGDPRVISAEAVLNVTEAVPTEEGVGCRGDALVKLLMCAEGGDAMPYTLTGRFPFAVNVPADGFMSGFSCRASAICTEISTEVTEDGRILCDLSGTVCVEGQGNLPVAYTADLYAADCESHAVSTEYRFPRAERCISGNFTQSVYEPLTSFGLAEDCDVLDVVASACADSITYDRGKWVIAGESRLNLLIHTGDEFATHDITLPFRYEADGEGGEPMLTAADVQMVSGRARVESGRLGMECEMAVSARVCVEESLTALTEVQFGDRLEKPTEMVVAFPARGETLWSLAKRYHTSVSSLVKLNAVSPNPAAVLATGEPIVIHE